jgi:hypothetical protein
MSAGVKPVVNYTELITTPVVGEQCYLSGVYNHPNSDLKGDTVLTSPVVKVLEHGCFETENTLYAPLED